MLHAKWIITEVALIPTLAYCVLLASGQPVYSQRSESKEAALVKEAYLAAKGGLQSGIGSGTYEYFIQQRNADSLKLQIRAKVKVYFEKNKYHVYLDYKKNETFATSRIIICDGKSILTSEFGDRKRIAPLGASAEIFSELSHDRRAAQAGFFFNPRDLVDEVLELESVLACSTLSITKDPASKLLGTYRVGDIRCSFEAWPEYGYNVASWKVFNKGSNLPAQDHRAVWSRADNVWFVKSITKDLIARDGTRIRHVLTYDSFEVNPKMPDDIFSFSALNIPQGTRILDQTPDANVREYYYRTPGSTDQAQLENLLTQVRSLSPQAVSSPPPPPRVGRYHLLITGAILCILGLLLLWRKRAKGRRHA